MQADPKNSVRGYLTRKCCGCLFGHFPKNFGTLWKSFLELAQPQDFCLVGVALFGARLSRKRRGERSRSPGFDSRRGAPLQHILLDIDDEDDEHEGDHKDDEQDEHDEDKNDDEDEFEDDRNEGDKGAR